MGRLHVRGTALAGAVLFFQLLPGMDVANAADPVLPLPENGGEGMLRLTSSVYPLDIPPLSAGQLMRASMPLVPCH